MAVAKKCDICGQLYEIYNTRNDAKNVNGIMFVNIDGESKYYAHDVMDCCPECIESIKQQIDILQNKKE